MYSEKASLPVDVHRSKTSLLKLLLNSWLAELEKRRPAEQKVVGKPKNLIRLRTEGKPQQSSMISNRSDAETFEIKLGQS